MKAVLLRKNEKGGVRPPFFIWLLLFVALGSLAFFRWIPHGVDRKRNALGPVAGTETPREIPALHKQLRVVDLHADTLLWDRALQERGDRGHVDLPRLREGGFVLQVFSAVTKSPRGINYEGNRDDSDNITILALAERWPMKTWSRLSERALYQARRLHDVVADESQDLRLIRTKEDLRKLLRDRESNPQLMGAMLSLEGGQALEGDLTKLDALSEAGFRIIGPAHLTDTDLSGSQQGEKKQGLTELGKKWLQEMDRRRLIVDLAHISNVAIDEVLEISKQAPLVSHTGVRAVCDNNRNLSDEQLRKIAAKGGLIGIGFWDEVNCGDRLENVVKSILHAVKIAGAEHVALGSDWDGFVRTPIDASQVGWLTADLLKAGLSEADVRAIMGENALRFFAQSLPD